MNAMEPDPIAQLALGLALIIVGAKAGAHIAVRLGGPAVLGELIVGIVLGNIPGAPFVRELASNTGLDMLARLGALILVFEVGLELTVREVFEVGVPSVLVAVAGTVFAFAFGWGASAWALDAPSYVPVFLGASVTATSIGITARVFKDLGRTRMREARIVLGAAVVDDVIGFIVLTVVTSWISARLALGHAASPSLLPVLVKASLFLGLSIFLGVRLAPRFFEYAARIRTGGALLTFGLTFCFILAWGASQVGLAPIVGAFTAGLILEESHSARFVARGERSLLELVQPLSSFLVPVFFVVMGMRTRLAVFLEAGVLGFALLFTVATVLGKLGCALGAGRGTNRLVVGFGMVPRGEVSLVFASLGASLGAPEHPVLDAKAYSSLVVAVVLSTLVAPAGLKWSLRRADVHAGARSVEA